MALALGLGVSLALAEGDPPVTPATEPAAAPVEGGPPALPTNPDAGAPPAAPAAGASDKPAKPSAPPAEPAPAPVEGGLPALPANLDAGAPSPAPGSESPQKPAKPSVPPTAEPSVPPGPGPAPGGGDPFAGPPPGEPVPPDPREKLGPVAPIGPPAEAPPPPPGQEPAPRDPKVERSQSAPLGSPRSPAGAGASAGAEPGASLPPARELPGRPAPSASGREPEPFVLSPERLQLGKQSVGLTVEVKGPPTMNLNQTALFRIIVTNPGTTDATNVTVRDELPAGLEFLSSQPAEQRINESLLVWNLNAVPAGSERVITLKLKPKKVGQFDHAATVTMQAGAKSQTQVHEPKLRVEQIAPSGKILKGKPVEFRLAVTNIGDGPARQVIVRAKLSAGLRVDPSEPTDQNLFEQDLGDLAPGQRVELDPLIADTIQGGEQSCMVLALSPDVSPGFEGAQATRTISVVEPKLKVSLHGPAMRYTDTIGTYSIVLENPGTVTARNVRVLATLPLGGMLVQPIPAGARFDSSNRRLQWSPMVVEPGEKEKVTLTFQVRMGGAGPYSVSAEARSSGLYANASVSTEVQAIADLDLEISEDRRVVDVGETTTFKVRIRNRGRKEATNLLVSAVHSDNIQVVETYGTDKNAEYVKDKPGTFAFPVIDRLGSDKECTLLIRVKALKPGQATCRVQLTHGDTQIDDFSFFKVTASRIPTAQAR
jgi:uncharacterized repeat protein (TIGR01451 family)